MLVKPAFLRWRLEPDDYICSALEVYSRYSGDGVWNMDTYNDVMLEDHGMTWREGGSSVPVASQPNYSEKEVQNYDKNNEEEDGD